MLLAWSYSAVVYLAIVVLTSLILQRPQPNPCFSKASYNTPFATFSPQSLFFKATYVWDVRRPRPGAK